MRKKLKNIKKRKVDRKIIVEDNVSIKEAVRVEIGRFYETHKNRKIFFHSVGIAEKNFNDYAVCLPVLREDLKKDFFIYWANINDLIAMWIKIGKESVLVIKRQFS